MTAAAYPVPSAPPEALRHRHRSGGLLRAVAEVWHARGLIRTLAERDYRVRYKQAVLGFAWAILTPVALMLVFTLVFQRVAKVHTHTQAPYALFSYLGLLPWTFFANSLNQGGISLLTNSPLLNKVYCPREVFPIACLFVAAADTVISLVGIVVLFVVFHTVPHLQAVLYLPLIILVQLAFTLGIVLATSIVVVFFRDLRYVLPVVLQVGLFATPVAYGMDDIPRHLRPLMSAVNPLAPVIDGYRRSVLMGQPPRWSLLGLGAASSVVVLVAGYLLFKRLEPGIADVA